MGLVDCLREAVLSAGADTKLQFSQRLLFCLAGNAEGNATPPERLEIGYLALRNWHEYAITRPCTAALFSWNYSGLDDNQSSLLCLLHLVVSLAVLTDTDGSPQAIDETESTGLSAVGRLVEIVKNGYAFDPLFAFMVLLEVSQNLFVCLFVCDQLTQSVHFFFRRIVCLDWKSKRQLDICSTRQ